MYEAVRRNFCPNLLELADKLWDNYQEDHREYGSATQIGTR
jgi:hypothetical protein